MWQSEQTRIMIYRLELNMYYEAGLALQVPSSKLLACSRKVV